MFSKKSQEKLRRVLSIIIVAALVLSLFGTLIYNLVLPAYAADVKSAPDLEADKRLIRIGLMYGSDVTVGFETDSLYGFDINIVNRNGDLTHTPIWSTDITKVSCIIDATLSKTDMTYSKTSSGSNAVVGGYHAELDSELTKDDLAGIITSVNETLNELFLYAIPSYINGSFRVRAGSFSSASDAQLICQILTEKTSLPWVVASPSDTAVSLVDPLTDKLLFEYDDKDQTALGITARNAPTGEKNYLITPAKRLYDGVFMFRRYISTDSDGNPIDGVSLTDVIPLGEYVKGVLPYEISSSWPIEAQKAFAIGVRSFAISGKHNHEKSYQVDLCNTSHCQVYRGRGSITSIVERAVDETAGLVMASGNEIVTAFYSAVAGGCTVGVDDAWGGRAYPYLVAVETPWEIYTKHSEGEWVVEVSPTELLTYLRDTKGYSNLRGEIKSITIDQLAKNSTYVYQLSLTDSYGTKITIKTTDGVRNALSKYLNSANFVVGKGSVKADKTTFTTTKADSVKIIDASSQTTVDAKSTKKVLTASGTAEIELANGHVISKSGSRMLSGTSSTTEKVTYTATSSNNFIFAGKGWGHGVGISQVGLRDLANLGYTAEEMLPKYMTGIQIVDWRTLS